VRMAQAIGRLDLSAGDRRRQVLTELVTAFSDIGGSQRARAAELLEELANDMRLAAAFFRREVELDGQS
jgi:hypothetical protein